MRRNRPASKIFLLSLLALTSIVGEAAATCGPGRPCPPPPPVTRGGRLPTYPGQRYPEPPPVQRGSHDGYGRGHDRDDGRGRGRVGAQCPPYTTYERRLGRCVADPYGRRRIQEHPPVLTGNEIDDRDERSAANIVNAALRDLDCGQAAESLRRLSNQILSLQASGGQAPIPGRVGRGGDHGDEVRRRWREHVRSPRFWKRVWNHMADAYRSCNRTCFDDGVAIGQISATAYCSASVAVDGLPGPGYLEQTPLPVCETSVFAGCLQSYGDTAAVSPGCAAYTTNAYAGIFAEYQSQDCHL